MAEDYKDIKKQRDRFLAFAFASADLLLEVNEKDEVQFASGAAKGFTGEASTGMVGKGWLDLFTKEDKVLAVNLRNKTALGKRCGPILINMNPELSSFPVCILTGMKLPEYPDLFFVTISQASFLSGKAGNESRDGTLTEKMDKESFTMAALDAIATANTIGQNLEVTFFDLEGSGDLEGRMDKKDWGNFKNQISAILRSKSIDGQMATEFEEGKYGLLHDDSVKIDEIESEIETASKESDPEGKGVSSSAQTIETKDNNLSEREFARALLYTINKFEEEGNALTLSSLDTEFDKFLEKNAGKITRLKSTINQQRFDFAFQPIVNLKSNKAHHFEALIRFEKDQSPYETITFGEDVGLSPDIDMMVCSKLLNYIIHNMKDDEKTSIAMNISGVSIQSEQFIKNLRLKLEPHLKKRNIAKRLMFEITESSQIKNLDQVNHFVKELQKDGFKIWLDDFGAGAASFQYLHKLHVDGVKIDGVYVDKILEKDRDATLVKSLVSMCNELGMKTIAERVETVQQAKLLHSMNVEYGQGFLFARPGPAPVYEKKKK